MNTQDAAKIIEGLLTVDRLRLLSPERAALAQAAALLREQSEGHACGICNVLIRPGRYHLCDNGRIR